MEIKFLKFGNLMGSPDLKRMMHERGPGTPEADKLWDDLAAIKHEFGLFGQSTSALLLEPARPDFFPALVDCSFISSDPKTYTNKAIEAALESIWAAGARAEEIKTCLVTHPHGDHHDPRLTPHFPKAVFYAPPGSGIPGARPLTPADCPLVFPLDTPGHGVPHFSYVVDVAEKSLSVCFAGDLIMSHAHFLSLNDAMSFSNAETGGRSVEAVLKEISSRPTRYKMIVPGHDVPFFVG